jgi:pimeloyl-ACP methyl ester carboxylesterase
MLPNVTTRPRRLLHPMLAVGCLGLLLGLALSADVAGAADPGGAMADETTAPERDDVVLLHGLGRSARAMRPLERRLAEGGYHVHNLDYPSTRHTPEALVAHVADEIGRCCGGSRRLHFVTHSMGGILLRAYLAEHQLPELGRVVMLAPPNRGSEYVDVAGDWAVFELFLGPTATQLGTDSESLPNRLPAADFDLGVIAGTGGLNWIGDMVLEGENDGTVSVASTRIGGMRDFIEIDVSHTFIMRSTDVARQTIAFLRDGTFLRDH